MTCLAGKDCTSDFEDIAHSDNARDWASKYIVGYLEGIDEDIKTAGRIPKTSDLKSTAGSGGGGGGVGVLMAVLAVVVAAAAYVTMK